MKYARFGVIVLWALASFACGGGGSNDNQKTSTISQASSSGGAPSPGNNTTSPVNSGTLGTIFDTIYSSGLLTGSVTALTDRGDQTLKNYLLTSNDLPAGFTSRGSFSEPIPSGVPGSGVSDFAVSVATKGDAQGTNGDNLVVLGSIAMKVADPAALQHALSKAKQLNAQDLRSMPGVGSLGPFVTSVQVLNTSSIGDNTVGLAVTVAETPVTLAMMMHVYLSVHGNVAGGVASVAWGGGSSGVDELNLTKIVDHRLAAASSG